MADQAISQADVQSLAQKLSQFTQTLTPGEQAALAAVVLRGERQSEDVQGFSSPGDRSERTGDREFDPPGISFTPVIGQFIRDPNRTDFRDR